jgi:predicted amidophosphoribosyltransferase
MAAEVVGEAQIEECPGCGRQRPADPGRYICSGCGVEFEVTSE